MPRSPSVSTAIELKEVYRFSPAYLVTPDGAAESDLTVEDLAAGPLPQGQELVEAGRFGFIYKQGKCKNKGCGHIARSPAGRLVDAYDRPPVEGRVARQSA